MNFLITGLGSVTLGFFTAYAAGRAAVALKHLRNAWLMRRGVDGLRDAAFSPDLAIASALLSLVLGVVLAGFLPVSRAVLVAGLAPSALYLALMIVACVRQALTLEQL